MKDADIDALPVDAIAPRFIWDEAGVVEWDVITPPVPDEPVLGTNEETADVVES